MGGFLFSTNITFGLEPKRNALAKDVFVFKIGGEVFGRKDLYDLYVAANYYNCSQKHSLLKTYFYKVFGTKQESKFRHTSLNISKSESSYFSGFIPFTKLLMYSKSFDLPIDLKRKIELLKPGSCINAVKLKTLNKNKLIEVISLDEFLKNRFLPKVEGYSIKKTDIAKANEGVRNLINSISKQISQETYW